MANPTSLDLHQILNPTLLRKVHDHQFPWPKGLQLNFHTVAHTFFGSLNTDDGWKELCYHSALFPISAIGFQNTPTDFLQFLPPPEDPRFPELSLGLILLFDQAPAHILFGPDSRYLHCYFRPLALRFFRQLLALPERQRPWHLDRWEMRRWSFEHWAIRQSFFYRPLTHSEDIDDHALQCGLHEHLRCLVERKVDRTEVNRVSAALDAHNTTLFERLIRDGPPKGPDVSMQEYVWWSSRVMDAHVPILREFGRYPYMVIYRGEEYAAREREYLEQTKNFNVPGLTDDQAQEMKEDIRAGRWPPLEER